MSDYTPDYSRQTRLTGWGEQGQQRLSSSKLLVIGAGGLGSSVLPLLAGAGVGQITVVDHDALDASNLHRQTLYRPSQIGEAKAELAATAIKDLNPQVSVKVITHKLSPDQLLQELDTHDLTLECTDDLAHKLMVSDAAVLLSRPVVFANAVQREGQLQSYTGEADSACFRCLWQQLPKQALSCEQSGVLGAVPAVLASLMACEALQWLLKNDSMVYTSLKNRVLFYDVANFQQRSVGLPISGQCLAHQHNFDHQQFFKQHKVVDLPLEFSGTLQEAVSSGYTIVDIRDSLTVSQQPLGVECEAMTAQQIFESPAILDDKTSLLVCYSGISSLSLANQLRAKGYRVMSKTGGAATP